MTILRYRNLRAPAVVSVEAENTENTLQLRWPGCIAAGLFAPAFVDLTSTAASADECCRWYVTSHIMSFGFDTLAQYQATSSGRGGDCARDPFLAGLRLSTKAPALENEKAGRESTERAVSRTGFWVNASTPQGDRVCPKQY